MIRDGADLAILPPKARLHIGHLQEDANKENLRAKFSKYGRIYELYVNPTKGFAFIQYDSAEEAANAIHGENRTSFEGATIAVKLANKDKFGNPINTTDDVTNFPGGQRQDPYMDREDRDRPIDHFRDRERERDLLDRPLRGRERSPLRDRYEERYRDRYERFRDPYDRDREDDIRRRDPYYEDRLAPPRDRYEDRYLPLDEYHRGAAYRDIERDIERDRERERERERERDRDRREPLDLGRRDILDRDKDPRDARDSYDRRAPPIDQAGPPSAPPQLPPTEKPIDCEILLLGKHLRDYADIVERRLKAQSLSTGLLLISTESSLPQALEDVTRRNVLFAVILTSQNELHRSVTLNILHGSPQEHRNMPLEDALALVDRNFTTYLQECGLPPRNPPSSALALAPAPLPGEPPLPKTQPPALPPTPKPAPPPTPAPAPVPATSLALPAVELTIPQLINLLADRKQLTLGEMDRVISHLQAVRRKMAVEQGVNPDPPAAIPAAALPPAAPARAAPPPAPAPVASASIGFIQSAPLKTVNLAPVRVKQVDKKQAELQARILSIFNPSGVSLASTGSTAAKTMSPISSLKASSKAGASISYAYGTTVNPTAKKAPAPRTTTDINFDSPVVQKVLDKLIQSGPTMLKQFATSANSSKSSSTMSKTQASNKAVKDMKNRGQISKPPMSKEQSDAQLRAAQTAALRMLQEQERAAKAKLVQQTAMLQQNQVVPVGATVQSQYQQHLLSYTQPNQYQQQPQAVYSQQYPQQPYQQQPMNGPSPRPLLNTPSQPAMGPPMGDNHGTGWPRGWKPPGPTAGNPQGFPGNQFAPQQHHGANMAYQQQLRASNRGQPTPPGI